MFINTGNGHVVERRRGMTLDEHRWILQVQATRREKRHAREAERAKLMRSEAKARKR